MPLDLKEIRELASRFTPEQIEGCITQQISTGENVCLRNDASEEIVNELAKAQFIRDLTGKGLSLAEALRELARRMRALHELIEKEKQ